VCPNPYQADIPQNTVVDEAFNFVFALKASIEMISVRTCASPKFDPGRKAWGLTQRALAFARRFSPEGSELESHGGLPIGRNTPVGNK
jgi:hypothetical protein